jgi:tyrosyl-tRNA synthetase
VSLERPKRFGGRIEYEKYSKLEMDYAAGKLHPLDLKNGAALYTDQIVGPIRAVLFND